MSNKQGWLSLIIMVALLGLHASHGQEGNPKPFCRTQSKRITRLTLKYMDCSNVDSFSFVTTLLPTGHRGLDTFKLADSPDLQPTSTDFNHTAFQNTWAISLLRCNVSTIHPEHFTFLPKLKMLSILSNNLTEISSSSFLGLKRLTTVDLYDNQIASVAVDTFTNLRNLLNLDLSQNKIAVLNDNTFKGLVALRNIDLTHNRIESISPGAFAELTKLSKLKLGYNNLQSLTSELFQTNTGLKALDLSGNNLAHLENYPLNIPSLDELKLNNCKIQSITVDYFASLKDITFLILSSNEISRIEDVPLEALSKLQYLFLDSNKFTSFNLTAFRELYPAFVDNVFKTKIGGLSVKDNPWNCSEPVEKEMVKPCQGMGIGTYNYEMRGIEWRSHVDRRCSPVAPRDIILWGAQ